MPLALKITSFTLAISFLSAGYLYLETEKTCASEEACKCLDAPWLYPREREKVKATCPHCVPLRDNWQPSVEVDDLQAIQQIMQTASELLQQITGGIGGSSGGGDYGDYNPEDYEGYNYDYDYPSDYGSSIDLEGFNYDLSNDIDDFFGPNNDTTPDKEADQTLGGLPAQTYFTGDNNSPASNNTAGPSGTTNPVTTNTVQKTNTSSKTTDNQSTQTQTAANNNGQESYTNTTEGSAENYNTNSGGSGSNSGSYTGSGYTSNTVPRYDNVQFLGEDGPDRIILGGDDPYSPDYDLADRSARNDGTEPLPLLRNSIGETFDPNDYLVTGPDGQQYFDWRAVEQEPSFVQLLIDLGILTGYRDDLKLGRVAWFLVTPAHGFAASFAGGLASILHR